ELPNGFAHPARHHLLYGRPARSVAAAERPRFGLFVESLRRRRPGHSSSLDQRQLARAGAYPPGTRPVHATRLSVLSRATQPAGIAAARPVRPALLPTRRAAIPIWPGVRAL